MMQRTDNCRSPPTIVPSTATNYRIKDVAAAIHKADELVDFAGHLGEIGNIFFTSSAKQDFSSSQEKQFFRERWLGRYIANHRGSFFVALDESGRVIGYLAGCLENPTELVHFSDIEYFQTIGDICRDYPAHLHINVAPQWRNRGLGAALVERFVLWVRLHSVAGIHLVTASTSRSIPFYRHSGFRELRTFPWNSGISVCMGRKL
jgi:GNAT superfamily N-acetyltransferase